MASSNQNTTTLPQGFSIYQPALGAQLQFLPAVGTVELDELIAAYVPGNASAQEKRASVSLDFLEYAHVTGQTFKFYPVYAMNPSVESPATDSGYGSSFNVSPVASAWDFSKIPASRSPSSQQVRRSPNASSSRHQTTDFSNLPGMKIMTKDGRDVTNSASRGSKTKEQRDHAHLMRIIKACDSCRRKKIRCDPSHKKRSAAQSQSAAKSTKKAKAVTEAVQAATSVPPPVDASAAASSIAIDQSFASVELESFIPSLPALEPWEEFIEYPSVDLPADYDFFYDPEGYFSPESTSSSRSVYSTKPVTPTSQEDISASYSLPMAESVAASSQLPFNQTESIHDYVDFNLFSPESSFSEDDNMVTIDLSRHLFDQSRSQQSDASQDHSPGGSGLEDPTIGDASNNTSWSMSPRRSGEDDPALYSIYRDPGAGDGLGCSLSPLSSGSDMYSQPTRTISEVSSLSVDRFGTSSLASDHADGDIAIAATRTPSIESVQMFAGIPELISPNAPRVGDNIVTGNVFTEDVTHSSQNMTQDQFNSSIERNAHIREVDENAMTHVIAAPSNYAHSRMETEIPGLESSAVPSGTLIGDATIANGLVVDNATYATNSHALPAFDTSVVRDHSSPSTSPALAPADTRPQALNDLQALVSDATSVASRSVISTEGESSISRGTGANAEIRHAEPLEASLPEAIITERGRENQETVKSDSYGKQNLRSMKSRWSFGHGLTDRSSCATRLDDWAKTWYAPCAAAGIAQFVHLGLLTCAMWILATNVTNSHMNQHLAMLVVLLCFPSVAGRFLPSFNAVAWHSFFPTGASHIKENIIEAFLGKRLDIVKSQASLGAPSVNLGVFRSGILIAV